MRCPLNIPDVSICPILTLLSPESSRMRLLLPAPVTPINAIIISGEEPDIVAVFYGREEVI